jgi:hypothetical protein
MAGPATNVATISVIGNSMGRKTLFIYLTTLILGAMSSGLVIDYLFPREWFTSALVMHEHQHGLLPHWLQVFSGVLMTLLIVNVYLK